MKFKKPSLILFCLIAIPFLSESRLEEPAVPPVEVTYCMPNQDVYPFFYRENGELTGINPLMMKQLFNHEMLPDTTIKFIQRPWKRCMVALEEGEANILIGGRGEVFDFLVYPDELGFTLEDSVISRADVCFYSVAGEQEERVRRGLAAESYFTVGIEAGFSQQHDSDIKVRWLELFNGPEEKYLMLKKGRVDAIIQVCAMDKVFNIRSIAERRGFNDFVKITPAYLSNPAYVIFGKHFTQKHEELAKRIIVASQKIDKSAIFERYKPSKQ